MTIVSRVSAKKEKAIMYDESNEQNLESFKKILKYFFYSKKTHQRVLGAIERRDRLDDLFKLNEQKRAWFKIEGVESQDKSYMRYKDALAHYYNASETTPAQRNHVQELWDSSGLSEYSNFKENKIKIGAQTLKLFKYLKKQKILNQETIEKITHMKSNDRDLYLCISRNVVDYIFLSTNQSFGSCINLNGEYCYWLGIPAMATDTSRFVAFVGSGKITRHALKGYEFKHYRYLTRTWGLFSDQNEFLIVRAFPSDTYGINNLVKEAIGFPSYKFPDYDSAPEDNKYFNSKYSFPLPKLQNGDLAVPYIDNTGYRYNEAQTRIYWTSNSGMTGCPVSFESGPPFEDVYELEDLEYNERYSCVACGYETGDQEELFYDEYDNYCESCYWDRYFSCESCNDNYNRDEINRFEGSNFCNYCYNEAVFYCGDCKKEYWVDEELSYMKDTCHACAEKHVRCEECDNEYIEEDECEFCQEIARREELAKEEEETEKKKILRGGYATAEPIEILSEMEMGQEIDRVAEEEVRAVEEARAVEIGMAPPTYRFNIENV